MNASTLTFQEYYSNPFAFDDDRTCFAEIEPDDTAHQASPQVKSELSSATAGRQASTPLGLQKQLREAAAENQSIRETYEAHIEQLRTELAEMNEENTTFYSTKSKLEAQIRALSLEKESAEWASRREKERNAALEEQVGQLQEELRKTRDQAQAMVKNLESSYAGRSRAASDRDGGRASVPLATGVSSDAGIEDEVRSLRPAPSEAASSSFARRGDVRASPLSLQGSGSAYRSEKDKENERQGQLAVIQRLEAQLLAHNKARDDLMRQLQRSDSMRVRSVADRARKAAMEQELEAEEQAIHSIRLQLRNTINQR